ncbi:cupin domain-containing protein [Aurantimonas sp. HBX-1]|uniref:cupin domain-containing protein n=1 Tax=Aurantimonas sp. HBX-1 TaxID=2906072 RepID=UPI001F1DD8E2|nr:cupin domain-containing protein [Aurantimonas sp. HBX-1]UIJ72504.1 cupin domain-containing protein [Aurantimonas sp. HBX-1]
MSNANTNAAGDWTQVDPKVRRRILSHTPEMMVVEVEFAPGGYGPPHAHPHLQSTYVKSGSFDFTIEGEMRTIREGDSIIVPSNAVHSCESAGGGGLIDVFSPAREDFLTP